MTRGLAALALVVALGPAGSTPFLQSFSVRDSICALGCYGLDCSAGTHGGGPWGMGGPNGSYACGAQTTDTFGIVPEERGRFTPGDLLERLANAVRERVVSDGFTAKVSGGGQNVVIEYESADVEGRMELIGNVGDDLYYVECRASEHTKGYP